jgi:hypothetical protein
MVAVIVVLVGLGAAGYHFTAMLHPFASPNDFSRLEEMTLLSDPVLRAKLIRTGEADYRYNCHGWTFTRGEREVHAEEVEDRLGLEYQKTTQPQLGDIVVYRDHIGQVMHSGVVTKVGEGGVMLVESKWGTSGRFLHEPAISRTFSSHAFYQKIPEVAKAKTTLAEDVFDVVEAMCDDQ